MGEFGGEGGFGDDESTANALVNVSMAPFVDA
jgi:hypothetical protein